MANTITAVTPTDLGLEFDLGVQAPNKITIKDGIFAGVGVPSTEVGVNGQYWLDTSTGNIWGPMHNSNWPETPIFYGNQGYVALDTNESVTMTNAQLNTFSEITPANTDPDVTIIVPPPTNEFGCFLGIWNNSPVSHKIETNGYGAFNGPAKFIPPDQPNSFIAQPDDLVYMVSDGNNWVIANYVSQDPVGGAATTTSEGIAREATIEEVEAGVTVGSSPAFVVPESLAALLGSLPLLVAGTGVPANNVGINGWYYTDVSSGLIYGPKENGTWPTALTPPIQIQGVFGSIAGNVL